MENVNLSNAKYEVVNGIAGSGYVIGRITYQIGEEKKWLSLIDVDGVPNFFLSDDDIFSLLKDDVNGDAEKYQIDNFYGINLENYEDIEELNDYNPYLYVVKTLVKIVTAGRDEADKLVNDINSVINEIDFADAIRIDNTKIASENKYIISSFKYYAGSEENYISCLLKNGRILFFLSDIDISQDLSKAANNIGDLYNQYGITSFHDIPLDKDNIESYLAKQKGYYESIIINLLLIAFYDENQKMSKYCKENFMENKKNRRGMK